MIKSSHIDSNSSTPKVQSRPPLQLRVLSRSLSARDRRLRTARHAHSYAILVRYSVADVSPSRLHGSAWRVGQWKERRVVISDCAASALDQRLALSGSACSLAHWDSNRSRTQPHFQRISTLSPLITSHTNMAGILRELAAPRDSSSEPRRRHCQPESRTQPHPPPLPLRSALFLPACAG